MWPAVRGIVGVHVGLALQRFIWFRAWCIVPISSSRAARGKAKDGGQRGGNEEAMDIDDDGHITVSDTDEVGNGEGSEEDLEAAHLS